MVYIPHNKNSNEIIDIYLKDNNISLKRIGDYICAEKTVLFQCLEEKCQEDWEVRFCYIKRGDKCPSCNGKRREWNNKRIDKWLKDNKILFVRKGEYRQSKIPLVFLCTKDGCDYEWNTPFYTMQRNGKCPGCTGNIKWNNEAMDDYLIDNDILLKRIGEYINIRIPILFQCLTCSFERDISPGHIIYNDIGCSKCSGLYSITQDEFDQYLLNNNIPIKRLGDYISSNSPVECICLIKECNHKWYPRYSTIKNSIGCPNCVGLVRGTNETLDQFLLDNKLSIRRVGNYINSNTPIQFECLLEECKYNWITNPNNIKHNDSGCPACSGNIKWDNNALDGYLVLHNIPIKRKGEYIATDIPIEFQCLNTKCNLVWNNTPTRIKCGVGCPDCSRGKNEKLVGTILRENNFILDSQKYINHSFSEYFRKIRIDYYIPEINIVIEYNGSQHYESTRFGGISQEKAAANFIKQQERDQYLQIFCNQNNIRLIWIDGRKYTGRKLTKYLIDIVIPELKCYEAYDKLLNNKE